MSIKYSLSTSRASVSEIHLPSWLIYYHFDYLITTVPLLPFIKTCSVNRHQQAVQCHIERSSSRKKIMTLKRCCMTTYDVTAGEMILINSVEINWLQEPSPTPLTTQWPWSQSISSASSSDDKQIKHALQSSSHVTHSELIETEQDSTCCFWLMMLMMMRSCGVVVN